MSNVNSPKGFKPLRYSDGRPYNGAVNPYRLASGYATNIFQGDVVSFVAAGVINKAAAGTQMRGVVVGFNWISAAGVPMVQNWWPASTVTLAGQNAVAFVIDDPNVIFEAVFTNSTSVPAQANMGYNFNLYDSGGSTGSGLSGEGVDFTTATTSAAQFQFLEFLQRADNDPTSAYSRGQFLPKSHDFRVLTGI